MQKTLSTCTHLEDCPVSKTIKVMGGKWKAMLLYSIHKKVNRFSLMYNWIEDISKKVLAQQLKEMENDKLIKKAVYPHIPKVEYTLTPKGESLMPIIELMYNWGKQDEL